jgi:hypothetical protein
LGTLGEQPSKEEVLAFLSRSASYGNLGLFIGAGFSKAVLNETSDDEIALSWGELLEKAAKGMHIDYKSIAKPGVSYPDVASRICVDYCDKTGEAFPTSLRLLKSEIARLTAWYPSPEQRSRYSQYLQSFAPSWIITTNYDLIIEALLTGESISLGPNDLLSARKGFIPVFHLHGVRTNPKEIIISQEDYVSLFRPTEYRQIKLALTIKESTTLFVGYGIGDVNVLTALDWSRNVFKNEQGPYPSDVVQVLYNRRPRESPYRDKHGIVIVEAAELSSFFEEFATIRAVEGEAEEKEHGAVKRLSKKLSIAETPVVERFIDDQAYRTKVLQRVGEFSIYLAADFVSFFDKCIAETWTRSIPNGAFHAYDQNLTMILDTLSAFDFKSFPPALFQTAAESLERVANFVGDVAGQSYAAKRTWEERKAQLNHDIVAELASVAKQYGYRALRELLKSISK